MRGTVLRAQSGFFWVATEVGVLECHLRGRLKRDRLSTDIAVIGDTVEVSETGTSTGAIEAVLPRTTRLARRAAFTKGLWKEDVIVANVDQVFIVCACANPAFSPRMLDRYLVLTEHNGIEAVIIANKVDLVGESPAHELFAIYEQLGYPVIYTSTDSEAGIEAIRVRLQGRISVVTGKSGVGKSTLLNRVQPGLALVIGDVSGAHGKGKHTTRVAELHPVLLPGGGYVADTPGIRELGLWRFPLEELDECFREFRPFHRECYFAGCTHLHEPGCAVQEALSVGTISRERYDSYVKLRIDA